MIDYIIFGFIDNVVMLAGALYGVSIEKHFPKRYQTGFMGATVGAGLGNSFSDFMGGAGAMNMQLAVGSGLGCLIALSVIPLYFTLEEAKDAPIDLGNICVDCFEDTSPGSGRFINRYPVSVPLDDSFTTYDGYRCEECDLKHAKEMEEDDENT